MLFSAVHYINDEEEGLQFGLDESEDDEYFAENADCAEVGFVFVNIKCEQVEVYEQEERAGHYGYDYQICLRF